MSKIQPVVISKVEKHHPEEKRAAYSPYEKKTAIVLRILGKSDKFKKQKKKRKKYLWLSGRLHIEERLNEGPRLH